MSILGTVCPNMSRPHPLCLFSEVASRLFSSGVHSPDFYRNFCSTCAVTVFIFGHLIVLFYLLTLLLLYHIVSTTPYSQSDVNSAKPRNQGSTWSSKVVPTVSKHVLERPGPQQEDQVEASEDARVACGTVWV